MIGRIVIDLDQDKGGIGIRANWTENGKSFGELGPLEVLAAMEQARMLILASAKLEPPLAVKIVGADALDDLKKLDTVN
jgi:hypothetical protein